MNDIEIHYFSGTGNSLKVAKELAKKLNSQLISAKSLLKKEQINSESEIIGFVFPLYDFKAPDIIEDIIKKFKNIDSKYIFAVCTYGISAGQSLLKIEEEIIKKGGNLSGGFAIEMPHSGIGSTKLSTQDQNRILDNCNKEIDKIYKYIKNKEKGTIETSTVLTSFLKYKNFKMLPALFKLIFIITFKGIKSIDYQTNEKCNSCGICEDVCPVDNIFLNGGEPVWGDNCLGCFACIQWCPKEAISLGGNDLYIKHYHHPEIKVSEMIYKKRSK